MGYGGGFFGGGWDTSVLKRHGLRIKYGGRDIDPDQIDWSATIYAISISSSLRDQTTCWAA